MTQGEAPRFLGPPQADPLARLNTVIDPAIDALWSSFDMNEALSHVQFMSQYWRLPGNPGFDLSIDRLRERLTSAGLNTSVDEYPGSGAAWDYSAGTVAIVRPGASDEVVLSREKERLALCINSFSTPAGGVVARLVDVGRGDRDEDYTGKAIEGAVVLGDADVGQLWRRAVTTRGAAGVISTTLPSYLSADPPGAPATPRDQWDILQWGSVPYDAARKAFGFKASPRAAARLRQQLKAAGSGEVSLRVTVASTFSTGPVRTLVAEIPGRTAPAERVVLAAHLQEPGANDNASGVATLAETAAAMAKAIEDGRLAAPGRTITFLFINEISGSRRWLQDHAAEAEGVRYMLSLDMTGEDVAKTGGSFLVERYPDPGAVWERPWDPHSEWGRGNVRADSLKGDLINDAHLAVCRRVARRTGWVVNTNPYEGGSDHTVFGTAGVPAVLDWHFTDRYYHTNFDTPDKTSPGEMRNVGVAAAATAWLFASANQDTAIAVAEAVAEAGRARVSQEEQEGARLAGRDRDPAAARLREATIVAAWKKWYAEAVRSASRLAVGPVTPVFGQSLEALAAAFVSARRPEFLTCPASDSWGPLPLRRDSVILAADRRGFAPCLPRTPNDRAARDAVVIADAAKASDPELRRLAAQAYGRLGDMSAVGSMRQGKWAAGPLMSLLNDPSALVRREAADAVGNALQGAPGDLGAAAPAAFAALRARLDVERTAAVSAQVLETIGRLRYASDGERTAAEAVLVAHATGFPHQVLGAARGLEALLRQNPRRPIADAARARLRQLAVARPAAPVAEGDDVPARTRRVALLALQVARDDDGAVLEQAFRDPDWQVRRLVALRLDLSRPDQESIGQALVNDAVFQVRYEVLTAVGREAARTGECAGLIRSLDDPEPTVVLHTIDLLPGSCTNADLVIKKLEASAAKLAGSARVASWHVPARAMMALARLRTESARAMLPRAATHAIWQVRASAAVAAGLLGDTATLRRLAEDGMPNVRTSAIEALAKAKSPAAVPAAIHALGGDDHQLVRTAAGALRGAGGASSSAASEALLGALGRLTDAAADTSRDPRLALIQRLEELLPPDRAAELLPYTSDFDPVVRAAAMKAYASKAPVTAVSAEPVRFRWPLQPSAATLNALPTRATLQLETGVVELALLADVAPVTVARFAELVRAGHYNGLTFHRIVPNFVVQGGSPGANEYVGVSRYLRDEAGIEPNVRGAVGISTRGRDTGDAQIFIDLVDLPRLDHDYTVFGRVTSGMDLVDRLLEGAVIKSVAVK